MYRRTVRGETWTPSLSRNSAVIRSLPQVTFARADRGNQVIALTQFHNREFVLAA